MGVVGSSDTKSAKLFEDLFPNIFDVPAETPSAYINRCWEKYLDTGQDSNALNGYMFEDLLATALIREGVLPFYMQAKAAFVPNVHYDILLYTPARGPIAISAKTSLRERYKQADLEAIALKYVHVRAQFHIVTLDNEGAASLGAKIRDGGFVGLDSVVTARSRRFDDLLEKLQRLSVCEAPTLPAVSAERVVTAKAIDKNKML